MYLGFLMMLCFQPILSIGNGTDLKIVINWSGIGLRRSWQPTPGFLPGKSQKQRSPASYSPWGCRVGYDWSNLAGKQDSKKCKKPLTSITSNFKMNTYKFMNISFKDRMYSNNERRWGTQNFQELSRENRNIRVTRNNKNTCEKYLFFHNTTNLSFIFILFEF